MDEEGNGGRELKGESVEGNGLEKEEEETNGGRESRGESVEESGWEKGERRYSMTVVDRGYEWHKSQRGKCGQAS